MLWKEKRQPDQSVANPGLSSTTEAELGYRARQYDDVQARNTLVECHLPLVRRMAITFVRRGANFDDLVQEGSLGLLRATRSFEPERGLRFATYAAFWIRSFMQRHVALLRSHQYAAPASVAYSGGLSRGNAKPRRLVRTVSLDAPARGEPTRSLGDSLANATLTPEDSVDQRESYKQVRRALFESLDNMHDQRAAVIIEKRLLSENPLTLLEVGTELDLSREGVRLIEVRLIKGMKLAFCRQETAQPGQAGGTSAA